MYHINRRGSAHSVSRTNCVLSQFCPSPRFRNQHYMWSVSQSHYVPSLLFPSFMYRVQVQTRVSGCPIPIVYCYQTNRILILGLGFGESLCPSVIAYQAHCVPVPQGLGLTRVPVLLCVYVPGPLCPSLRLRVRIQFVSLSRCVLHPLCPSPRLGVQSASVSHFHGIPGPLYPSPRLSVQGKFVSSIMYQANCVPSHRPRVQSASVSHFHGIPCPLYPSPRLSVQGKFVCLFHNVPGPLCPQSQAQGLECICVPIPLHTRSTVPQSQAWRLGKVCWFHDVPGPLRPQSQAQGLECICAPVPWTPGPLCSSLKPSGQGKFVCLFHNVPGPLCP